MRWKGLKIVSAGLLMVAGICMATCDNVKDLDDNARISVVKIEVASPSAVLLGDPQIEKEEVVIPLIFGKYLFPIEIRVDIQTVQTIDKILGLSAGNGMVFESLEEINRIDLVALSGVVHSYIFKLNEVPSSEDANIEKFEITSWTPDSFLFIRAPHYDVINGVIEIIGVSNHFPFTITPRITISDGAKMETSVAVNSFTFTSYTTQFPIKVVAESGKERLWQIGVKQAQIIRPQEAPDVDSRARLSINTQAITATLSGGGASEIKSVDVDADNSTIRITIQTQHVDSQWEAQLSFQVPPYTEIVGYESGEAFTIDGMGLQKSFYLIDILEGCGVEWKIESVRWLSPAADIESFELISYESEYSLIELGAPVIYPYLATVEIPLEGGFGFPLIIDSFGLQISEDALLMDPLPEKLIFNDFDTKYTVRIEAQDKSVKNWTIALYDARSGNSEARVTGYAIKSYAGTSSTDNNLILNPQAAINADNKTITLHILDWAHKLPLKVEGRVDISTGARLFPFSFLADHSLIFDSLEDTFSFTIISENGETEQTWTILLQNDALPKSSAKEVIDFISGAPSIGFLFAEKYLEHEKRQITLIVSERPSGAPLILAPRIAVSPQARLLEIVSGAQLSLSFDQPKLFYVQAEDEGIDEWRIVLVYAPQIPNSGFESWGRANNSDMNLLPSNGTGWCTSNNSTMSNASRVAGFNSPYAVQMQTVLQTMNFVIFRVTTIAASSAFLGRFTLKTGVNDVYNPISMTSMGIPFTGNPIPIAFSIDYKYVRGAQMMLTEPNWGSLIPSFRNPVNIPGTDAASLRVELYHNPSGIFDYAAARRRNDHIAKGEILERDHVPEWTHAYMPIEVVPGKEGVMPTHIVVVLTSSHEGDYFRGAPGSTLTADNFTLIYYKPEEGAVRLE